MYWESSIDNLIEGRNNQENALRGLGRKFILVRMEYVDKTSASKNTQREAEKKLVKKNDGMRDFII